MKGLMDMVVLRIDKSLPDMATLVLLGMRMRGCLTQDLKGRLIIAHNPLSRRVVRNMRITILPVGMVAMDVVRVVT